MSYKIGSFNMRNIGTSALSKGNDRNLQLIAKIIREENFDVVALQEVLNEGKAFDNVLVETSPECNYFKKSILMELGGPNEWGFRWAKASADPDSKDKRVEGYAFLWNKKRLDLATTIIAGGSERTFNPRMCNINKSDLIRKPYYARFTPVNTIEGGPWIELRLLCIHTYWGKDDVASRLSRQKELEVLMTDVYPQISDRRYGQYGNGRPAYTILLGDYNAELKISWKEEAHKEQNKKRIDKGKYPLHRPLYIDEITETTKWGEKRTIRTVQHEFTTLKSIDTDDELDEDGYAHDYDHFSYEEEQFAGIYIKARRVDAVTKYCKRDFKKYHDQVSDHIPIMMELTFDNELLVEGDAGWKEKNYQQSQMQSRMQSDQ